MNDTIFATKGGEGMQEQDLAKLARAAYAREYRRRNPEKIKKIQERYWKNKALKMEERENGKNSIGCKRHSE